ncbi:hypothetical protein [Sulfitobacter guttiformis]|nr:hypothetical protein [Sulfitobacter guttiformis]
MIQELIDEDRIETELAGNLLELGEFFILPAYQRFIAGAYACGFVCNDLAPSAFDIHQPRVAQTLSSVGFADIRAFTHVLLRAERWADGMTSPVRDALASGALAVVGRRIADDCDLYAPF